MKFIDVVEIFVWVYLFKNFRELYLIGNLNFENNKMIGFEFFRELRYFKIFYVKSNLIKVFFNIIDVVLYFIKLVIYNDGIKFLVLNSFKKMMNVVEFEF